MRNLIQAAVILALLILPFRQSQAAEIEVVQLDDDLTMITMDGAIEGGDAEKFREIAALHKSAVVVLESSGGSTIDAIEIGEAIRLKGFSTLVLNGSQCDSACALIWLAGSPRILTNSARVGLHATYVDRNGQKLESGVGNALVGRYLTLLNLPMQAVVFATQAPPDRVSWLDASSAQDTGISIEFIEDFENSETQESVVNPPPSINIAPAPASQSETQFFSEADDWLVMVDYTIASSCFVFKYFPDGTFVRLNNDARASLNPSLMSALLFLSNAGWTSLEAGQEFDLVFAFEGFDPWNAPATVVELGSTPALRITIGSENAGEFKREFSQAETFAITRNGQKVATLNLAGANKALQDLAKCQTTANRERRASDPFAD